MTFKRPALGSLSDMTWQWDKVHRKWLMVEKMQPEVEALLERGNITLEDIKDLRCNLAEWRALQLKMTDDAFLDRLDHALVNCSIDSHLMSYNDSVIGHFVPELVRRFERMRAGVRAVGEALTGTVLEQSCKTCDGVGHYMINAHGPQEVICAKCKGTGKCQ